MTMKYLCLNTVAGAMLVTSAPFTDSAQVTGKTEAADLRKSVKLTEPEKQHEFNDVPENTAYGMYPESDILDEQVDSDDYQMQVVEDNENIRIIILKVANGQPQYKSIFVKDKNMVKVIGFDEELVFQGVIGT